MLTFLKRLAASVPTPATDKVTVFVEDSTGEPSYKDDTGTVTSLKGDPGEGVPAGGTAGQVLRKIDGTDYNTEWATPAGGGDVVGPASSVSDRVALFDGTTGKLLKDGGKTIAEIKQIEQNSQSGAYTMVLADAGKHILHPSSDTTARIFTIPANSSVAYPIGTAITVVNQNAAGVVTIAITSDTMRLAGAGTTGSRTLAANGIATALKITSTEWIISGTGLT